MVRPETKQSGARVPERTESESSGYYSYVTDNSGEEDLGPDFDEVYMDGVGSSFVAIGVELKKLESDNRRLRGIREGFEGVQERFERFGGHREIWRKSIWIDLV
ncbi:unnamed protein product, partial [Cuscuta epithymum]